MKYEQGSCVDNCKYLWWHEPEIGEVCPGEDLDYTVSATFHQTGFMSLYRTIVNVDTGLTAWVGEVNPISTIRVKGEAVSGRVVVKIPVLSPGNYEARTAVEKSGAESSVYIVPFIIKDNCP